VTAGPFRCRFSTWQQAFAAPPEGSGASEEANTRLTHLLRLAAVGELMAAIAHEVNQPLGAILCNADAADVLLKAKALPLDELPRILADIRKDAVRAGEVMARMRSLLCRREMSMRPLDLNRAISDTVDLVRADLSRRQVTVDTKFRPVPIVHGDPVLLQQVVLNLLLNGVDAMAETASSHRRLEIHTSHSEAGGVEVTVSDAGHGLSPEHATQIFDSFFTTKPNGIGLGLTIARSIIETHGGKIWAETRREGGARFRFCLPLPLTPETSGKGSEHGDRAEHRGHRNRRR
jgi:C4-dicarboxylate-specific signal transduction histidine kinase